MKLLTNYAVILFSILSLPSFAQQEVKKESFKVGGKCEMCKKKIETAATSAGATYANWNEHTKIMKVAYDPSTSNTIKIQKAVAAAGYDTPAFIAGEEAYNNLEDCCKYPRKQIKNNLKQNL